MGCAVGLPLPTERGRLGRQQQAQRAPLLVTTPDLRCPPSSEHRYGASVQADMGGIFV